VKEFWVQMSRGVICFKVKGSEAKNERKSVQKYNEMVFKSFNQKYRKWGFKKWRPTASNMPDKLPTYSYGVSRSERKSVIQK
jgi:1,2-phenylacetyl-CoA epoxidase PaaB subunit